MGQRSGRAQDAGARGPHRADRRGIIPIAARIRDDGRKRLPGDIQQMLRLFEGVELRLVAHLIARQDMDERMPVRLDAGPSQLGGREGRGGQLGTDAVQRRWRTILSDEAVDLGAPQVQAEEADLLPAPLRQSARSREGGGCRADIRRRADESDQRRAHGAAPVPASAISSESAL